MNPLTHSKKATILRLLIAVALTSFWLSPTALAVVPAPDGGYANQNTAEGTDALFNLTTGVDNTAIGFDALFNNTTGNFNTASGEDALFSNITGAENTATGVQALFSNTNGTANTATGVEALFSNTTGNFNTASGVNALFSNTTGGFNTATGINTLASNTTGNSNTASGSAALVFNTTGIANTADGANALLSNTTGSNNTASGSYALFSNTTGNKNIAVGFQAGFNLTTGSNNIDIGAMGTAGESSKIRIGTVGTQTATFIAGISGVTVPGGVGVIVGTNGKLGTVVSSERFKDEVRPMDKASEAILALKPVTFYYKHELDPDGIPQFGLVAEQVEKVNPDLVARDEQGKPYTVRYEAVNAMLLNEFLKEHRRNQQQEAAITELESALAEQQKEIKALTETLQKVSARGEAQETAPRLVTNH